MTTRPARLTDFAHLETFVWQAIFPAFDRDGLNDEQRAENDALVANARTEVFSALDREHHAVFVATDERDLMIAYLIVDARPRAYAEISRLIVKRAYWGKGAAAELMTAATDFIGRDRAVSLAVRHYNERALAFFAKHDFADTGETTGDHAIPRTLLLREAYEDPTPPTPKVNTNQDRQESTFDFPSAADEPVFEALPDYTLSVEDTPIFETGHNALRTEDLMEVPPEDSSLSDQQLTELEAFIARARAKKGERAPLTVDPPQKNRTKPVTAPETETPFSRGAGLGKQESRTPYDPSKIEFEIDYGAAAAPVEPTVSVPTPATAKSSFEFAFDPAPSPPSTPEVFQNQPSVTKPEVKAAVQPEEKVRDEQVSAPEVNHKICPDCSTQLPVAARFCFSCGHPQPDPNEPPSGEQAPEDDVLLLEELPLLEEKPPQPSPAIEEISRKKTTVNTSGAVSLTDLKTSFREHLQERLEAYFGTRRTTAYLKRLETATDFQRMRDSSLSSLAAWLNDSSTDSEASARDNRRLNTLADLTEYFIVESCADLHQDLFPQRLLRHQSVDWNTADIFQLVMDYLNFEAESEVVYTDFVVMPTRALRNATKSFLQAAKDERVFFICDQSLISQAKNGFAVTDSGIYWKNVLQPAGSATFTTMMLPNIQQGHLVIDNQFFDAGGRLNLKIALLLDKLRRMAW